MSVQSARSPGREALQTCNFTGMLIQAGRIQEGRHMPPHSRTTTLPTRSANPKDLYRLKMCWGKLRTVCQTESGRANEPLVETVSGRCASRLDVPRPLANAMQAQLLRHFCGSHGVWQILLVGHHKERGSAQLFLQQHLVQLFPRHFSAVAII